MSEVKDFRLWVSRLKAGLLILLAALLTPGFASTANAADVLPATADLLSRSLFQVESAVVPNGRTVAYLGDTRSGSGVMLDQYTVLTIGYLLLEADEVDLTGASGRVFPASVAAYDHASGLGLIRSALPLDGISIRFGDSANIAESEYLLSMGAGDDEPTEVVVVSRRQFTGSWEYMLDKAIYTFPPVENWSGSALTNKRGELVGIGSLMVDTVSESQPGIAGNMFVPIDLLKPILADLKSTGKRRGPPQPWLGLSTEMVDNNLVAVRVSPDGPADSAGVEPGDQILQVASQEVRDQPSFYRHLWQAGSAGDAITLTVSRNGRKLEFSVQAVDRMTYLKRPEGV